MTREAACSGFLLLVRMFFLENNMRWCQWTLDLYAVTVRQRYNYTKYLYAADVKIKLGSQVTFATLSSDHHHGIFCCLALVLMILYVWPRRMCAQFCLANSIMVCYVTGSTVHTFSEYTSPGTHPFFSQMAAANRG